MDLMEQGYAVFPLKGNHEDLMLKSHHKKHDKTSLMLPVLSRTKGIRDKSRKLFSKYLQFFEKLPYYYELDHFYLVHAGFDYATNKPFEDFQGMMWISDATVNNSFLKNKTLIHGHSKRTLQTIQNSIENKNQLIGLDNATLLKDEEYGNMVCLNLDTYQLFIQPNIDRSIKIR